MNSETDIGNLNTVNVDILAQLNFCAAKFSRIKLYVTFSSGHIYAHVVVNSISAIMIYLFTPAYVRASKTLPEMHEHIFCAEMSTFTVEPSKEVKEKRSHTQDSLVSTSAQNECLPSNDTMAYRAMILWNQMP